MTTDNIACLILTMKSIPNDAGISKWNTVMPPRTSAVETLAYELVQRVRELKLQPHWVTTWTNLKTKRNHAQRAHSRCCVEAVHVRAKNTKKVTSSKHQLRVQMLIVHASKTSMGTFFPLFLCAFVPYRGEYMCILHMCTVLADAMNTTGEAVNCRGERKKDELTEIEKSVDSETYRFILYIWSDINNKMHVRVCVHAYVYCLGWAANIG